MKLYTTSASYNPFNTLHNDSFEYGNPDPEINFSHFLIFVGVGSDYSDMCTSFKIPMEVRKLVGCHRHGFQERGDIHWYKVFLS